jgi:hypothetical protein
MQGGDMITEIENHFRFNDHFRFLFPEFCPDNTGSSRWGSRDDFTIPNRRRKWLKEPTMRVVTVGKVVAGPHYEVIKHSDVVDKENSRTPTGIKDVKDHFKYTMPLLERGPVVPGRQLTRGWVDLEGTIYDFSDLYCEEIEKDEERSKRGQSCRWSIHKRDSIIDPRVTSLSMDDAEAVMWTLPNLQVLWPKRFPVDELKALYEDIGSYIFNCQYRLKPSAKGMNLATTSEIKYFPARFKKVLLPTLYMKTTIDLAGMEEDPDLCNTAITTVGHAKNGRKYVFEALVGRPTPFEIINYIFELDLRYSTNLSQKLVIQVEKAHHADALKPFIEREMQQRNQWLTIRYIPRDSTISKDNRIFYGLNPWFKKGLIWFADDIYCTPHIVNEVTKFPKYKYKDFLDSLTDQNQTTDGKVDQDTAQPNIPRTEEDPLKVKGKFMGFNPVTKMPMYSDEDPTLEAIYGDQTANEYYHSNMTGGLS